MTALRTIPRNNRRGAITRRTLRMATARVPLNRLQCPYNSISTTINNMPTNNKNNSIITSTITSNNNNNSSRHNRRRSRIRFG